MIDSCILASTITLRPQIQFVTELLPPSWVATSSRERVERLLHEKHAERDRQRLET